MAILAASNPPHPPALLILPFVLLLAAIAVMPFINKSWWERHYWKASVLLGSSSIVYYLVGLRQFERVAQVAHEYVSFIALVGSLFVVSGSILIRVKGEAKPWVNCVFLALGAILANVIGTTGASMLLIRPWIRMNKYRITAFHIVFFIFIVSNAGGCLTPIGDPPLFLGYLRGVPFWWVAKQAWMIWLVVIGLLVAIFGLLDRQNFLRASRQVRERETASESWHFDGLRNLWFLGAVLLAVFLRHPPGLSEGLMLAAAVGAYRLTAQQIHDANEFNFGPLREVAWLFAGIFATMMPALDYLGEQAEQLGLDSAMSFYWLTGSLSSVLDNAPTYLTFLALAMGREHLSVNAPEDVRLFLSPRGNELLAISLGAVLFGAMTYIGNGPNFMVKAIAEQSKVRTPSFFDYLFRYALPVLLPIFGLVAVLCFWRGR